MAENAEVEETFGAVSQALADAKVDAAFIGAIAVIAWSRIRTTTDVDLVISASEADLGRLRPCLERLGFSAGAPVTSAPGESVPDISVFWSGHRPSVRVDVFHAKTDFEREALRLAVPAEVAGRRVRVATAEAVIVYKVMFNKAWKHLDGRRPARAFEHFLAAAGRAHLSSQLMVGYLYDVGRGVRRSRAKAFLWYRKAARRGDALSASNIGILYKEVGSFRRAKWWLRKSVAMGEHDSLLDLAKIELESGNKKAALRHLRTLRRRSDTTEDTQEQAEAMLARLSKHRRPPN